MGTLKILVPYNFTVNEQKALDFVVGTYTHGEDVRITLFHVYTPVPEIDMGASPELRKMKSGMAFLSEELRGKEEGLKSAKVYLLENGFAEEQIDYIFRERKKTVPDEIIETAAGGNYRVLVLSRQPGKVSRLFARSVHSKVLSTLKDVIVCIPT